ncbi:MAG: hypothetical protein ACRDY3_01070, partial [Acidimicrobiales bacterium]
DHELDEGEARLVDGRLPLTFVTAPPCRERSRYVMERETPTGSHVTSPFSPSRRGVMPPRTTTARTTAYIGT